MQTVLQTLVGTQLTAVTFIHDYLQLSFSNDSGLTINNSYTWSTNDYVSVIESHVTEVLEKENEYVIFNFSNGDQLKIDMRPEGFRCPEALAFYQEGAQTPVIWN